MGQNRPNIGNDLGLKSVLVARFSALGDVAMTVPVLYSACECYPQVRFVMVTKPSMVPVFINKPQNLEVVGADVKKQYAGLSGLHKLVGELVEKYQCDGFIDLHDVLRTKVMRLFCRLRRMKVVKLNKGRAHKRALTRRTNKVMLPLSSSRARYREAFFKAGMPLDNKFQGLYGPSGKGSVELFTHITGGPKPAGQHWIGIAPFAAHAGKVYPAEKMTEVIEAIQQRANCRVFIFGAGGYEQKTAEAWEKKFSCVTSVAGKRYGFPAELALLSHLDLMLTMDSANMHLAAIAGTRTISIWGATHYYCGFKGWHQRETDMIQVPLSCRPCSVFGDKRCYRGDMLCLNAIRPDTIVHKIEEVLESKS